MHFLAALNLKYFFGNEQTSTVLIIIQNSLLQVLISVLFEQLKKVTDNSGNNQEKLECGIKKNIIDVVQLLVHFSSPSAFQFPGNPLYKPRGSREIESLYKCFIKFFVAVT